MYAGITFIMYAYSQTNNKNATGRWISPGPPVSSIKKTDRPDITEILLKVVLNTIKQTFNALSKILTSCWCFQERYYWCITPFCLSVIYWSLESTNTK
jgi:hypothetical protein